MMMQESAKVLARSLSHRAGVMVEKPNLRSMTKVP